MSASFDYYRTFYYVAKYKNFTPVSYTHLTLPTILRV